jgi:hypothetical protein
MGEIYDIPAVHVHVHVHVSLYAAASLTELVFYLGYDEALGQTLTNECSVSQFVDAADPIRLLTDATAILFREEDDVYKAHPDTTDEILTCLHDLKVRVVSVLMMCGCFGLATTGEEVRRKLFASEPHCCSGAGLTSGKPTAKPVCGAAAKTPLCSLILPPLATDRRSHDHWS